MTAFTTLSSASLAVGKPLTSTIALALRDNPLAIAEGDASAPRIEFAALGAWYLTAGGIGTYCFAKGTADVAFSGTTAGSNLAPSSAVLSNFGSTGAMSASFTAGVALSGTWQCMGYFDLNVAASGGGTYAGITLWLRIA